MEIRLTLPFPPSTNRIWQQGRTWGGKRVVHLSKSYRTWLQLAHAAWWQQRLNQPVRHIAGPFNASLTFHPPNRRHSDADNRLKATFDFLQKAGIIENDKFQRKVSVEWVPEPSEDARVEIVLKGLDHSLPTPDLHRA